MKTFIMFLVLVLVGVGIWALWPDEGDELVIESRTPSPSPSAEDLAFLRTPTPVTTATATPRVSPTPTPGQGGEGPAPSRVPVFATMVAVNGSGQSGVAALTASDDDLATISFNLNGSPVGVHQHAYIVHGVCSGIGSIAYALNPLMNGSSMTILNVDFLDIAQSQTQLAIVVYSPEGELQIPYSCGQLR